MSQSISVGETELTDIVYAKSGIQRREAKNNGPIISRFQSVLSTVVNTVTTFTGNNVFKLDKSCHTLFLEALMVYLFPQGYPLFILAFDSFHYLI
jgi:hypothetical protein